MDPNAFTWLLIFALHGSGSPQTCCAVQGQIEIPSIECKKTATDDCSKVSAYEICKAIGDMNKDATFSVVCMAKPK